MRRILSALIVLSLMVFACGSSSGEKLVYQLVHKRNAYKNDNGVSKTEFFSIDVKSQEKELVFTDEGSPIAVQRIIWGWNLPVMGGNKIFATAAERNADGRPNESTAALYELSTDGSNSFRKVAPKTKRDKFDDIFVNAEGTRVGHRNNQGRSQYLLVHDLKSGELLQEICIDSIFYDCFPAGIGWMPGEDRVFFSLETGDVHVTSDESYGKVGTYIMDIYDESVVRLDTIPGREGYSYPELVRMIGVLPSGENLFSFMQRPINRSLDGVARLIYIVEGLGTDSMAFRDVSFGSEPGLPASPAVSYLISPSGQYLAASNPLKSGADTLKNVWLKNLHSGEDILFYSQPSKGYDGPFLRLVGWLR